MGLDIEVADFCLCYAEMPRLWFADLDDLGAIEADDWDDGWRQGGPFEGDDYTLIRAMIDGPFEDANVKVSPERINEGRWAWVKTTQWASTPVALRGGVRLDEAIGMAQQAGGDILLRVGDLDRFGVDDLDRFGREGGGE